MKRLFIIFLLIASYPAIAQKYLDKTKTEITQSLKTKNKESKTPVQFSHDTAGTLTFPVQVPGRSAADLSLFFDEKDKCVAERITVKCDSCLAPWLNPVLATTNYKWTRINENQYVSDFNSRLMLELPPDGKKNSYKLMRMDWTKELYELLMKN